MARCRAEIGVDTQKNHSLTPVLMKVMGPGENSNILSKGMDNVDFIKSRKGNDLEERINMNSILVLLPSCATL